MRKVVIALAAAAAVAATPVNAQSEGGQVRALESRIHNVLRSLDGVRPDQRGQIRAEATGLDRQLHMAVRHGLNPAEAHDFDVRIGQLEQHQQSASLNGGHRGHRHHS